jgi:hypothetical protein
VSFYSREFVLTGAGLPQQTRLQLEESMSVTRNSCGAMRRWHKAKAQDKVKKGKIVVNGGV